MGVHPAGIVRPSVLALSMVVEGKAPSGRFQGEPLSLPGDPHACRFLCSPMPVLEPLGVSRLGSTGGLRRAVPWSRDITILLSVSLAVAQRLRKLDFPVKDSEEPSAPGADKSHFLRARGPEEDTGKVSATDTWAETLVESGDWSAAPAGWAQKQYL